jgi:hypothetical protein
MKRNTRTKAEKEYVKALIQNLSLQRLTDQEIVDYLNKEKKIKICRSTVTITRNKMEREAGKWYIELKQSANKYIAAYKQRLESLLYYQKKLNQIVYAYLQPMPNMIYTDTVIRAISELHRIEMSIFNLWKELPELDIVDKVKQNQAQEQVEEEEPPLLSIEDLNGVEELPAEVQGTWHNWEQCDHCKRWWSSRELLNYHKKKSNNSCDVTNIQ